MTQTPRNLTLLDRPFNSSKQNDIQVLQAQVANLTTIIMAITQRDESVRADRATQLLQNLVAQRKSPSPLKQTQTYPDPSTTQPQ